MSTVIQEKISLTNSPVKILFVDDESDMETLVQMKFRHQIKQNELQFFFAANGQEAIQKFIEDPAIEIVITDINMPKMDGLTLLDKLPETNRLYKALIISAYGDMSNIRTAMNRGASDFIVKPIDFKDLAITITKTVEQLKTHKQGIAAQSRLLSVDQELEVAKTIQQSFLPHRLNPFPNRTDLEIVCKMIPARQVGGDFYDFFALDDHLLGIIVADVSGKGIPAALFMSMARTAMHSIAYQKLNTSDCMKETNYFLSYENESSMFVTVFYAILDLDNKILRYCNAGHNPPFVLRKDGELIKIGTEHGLALGITDKLPKGYTEEKIPFETGDTLFLFTDGITEAMDRQENLYSEARLEQILKKCNGMPTGSLIETILTDINSFTQGAPQSDDLTLVCVRLK